MDYNFIINNINNININDINDINLSELKTILYMKKNLSDDIKNKINTIIHKKISNTKKIIYNKNDDKKINIFKNNTDSDDNTDTDSDDTNSKDILINNNDINKRYDRIDKKGQNQQFTQTSNKLFNRMFSEASYINNIGNNDYIIRPYADTNNNTKLGIRKNIKKY